MIRFISRVLLTSLLITGFQSFCRAGQDEATLITRYSFISCEPDIELLVTLPETISRAKISAEGWYMNRQVISWSGTPVGRILRLSFPMDRSFTTGTIELKIRTGQQGGKELNLSSLVTILSYKPNEVKIDRLTGGLIVNRLPFFPFGFYCYSPVYPTLPEEEVVKGFNMISPYQKILPETVAERKAYMDRCARLGMKVHYNLLSVSGGGGVGSKIDGISDDRKRELLLEEIRTFMDHPALLAWYISDEPNGTGIPPKAIEEIYNAVKKADPWHPVSVVFMTPFTPAIKYASGVDIVMADPYPVPDYPVTMAGNAAASLLNYFDNRNPVWIVPQAFGGGEHWRREPTAMEIRSMTWQAIAGGATGIQYFIRHGLNSFPKSTATWGECGKIAVEVASITPWLLSDEEPVPVSSSTGAVKVTSRLKNGQLVVIAVNTSGQPLRTDLLIRKNISGKASVLFENRTVNISSGVISDFIPAFGTLVYRIDTGREKEADKAWAGNLITDPGFEDNSSPGVPAACYARTGSDRGATFFTDPREKREGNYSLRLITPVKDKSVTLRFFPIRVKSGRSYLITVWAKSDPEQSEDPQSQFIETGMADFGMSRFIPGKEWKQYVTSVTIPSDTLPEIKANVILRMPGQGVAWFDLLQVIEDPLGTGK